MTQAARITILGAGFGALATCASCAGATRGADHRPPRGLMHYLPSIIWIPQRLRRREDSIVPLGRSLSAWACAMWQPRSRADDGGRSVHTTAGDIDNDALVIATVGASSRSCRA
jgi:sulfide:quinone oxidoreductase